MSWWMTGMADFPVPSLPSYQIGFVVHSETEHNEIRTELTREEVAACSQ